MKNEEQEPVYIAGLLGEGWLDEIEKLAVQ